MDSQWTDSDSRGWKLTALICHSRVQKSANVALRCSEFIYSLKSHVCDNRWLLCGVWSQKPRVCHPGLKDAAFEK